MERTLVNHALGHWVLLAAMTFQALTPDTLDLAALADFQVPNKVVALLGGLAEEQEGDAEEELSEESSSDHERMAHVLAQPGLRDILNRDPANLRCTRWPDLGLASSGDRRNRAIRFELGLCHNLPIDTAHDPFAGRPNLHKISREDGSYSPCRLVC